jgi:purine-nucleoside phosphorylase
VTARRLAFIAGSGMDSLARAMAVQREVRFDDIEGVGACGVEGHSGRVLEGTVEGRSCTLVVGRRHVYEGDPGAVARLIEWLAESGVTDLVMASAAGALHRGLVPGDLVVARDVIDVQNRERISRRTRVEASVPRRDFRSAIPDVSREDQERRGTLASTFAPHQERRGTLASTFAPHIDPGLSAAIERAATAARVSWQRGTMVCGVGPAYETESEVRALQRWGDVATMSAAPELAAAGRLGVRAAAVALVTNPCTGVAAARPNHSEVLAAGARAAGGLGAVIAQLVVE